ncbi:tetratricopeptide repeat protein [Geopsychrobacter electrodiphilus]|uniref:tetratricopeptide repeat protein n=1 Tax=Geopsychrobacter electrodiphilus TaxID=225196 RepID=UPI000374AB00|nr:hypothetical protein [Geopsychrobacter electrodiphilus]
MGLFGTIFGAKPSLEKIQRALAQKNYAEALHQAEDLLAKTGETPELLAGMTAAADGLARLNLDEGLRSQEAGERILATEHLKLALSQARSLSLVAEIERALSAEPQVNAAPVRAPVPPPTSSPSGCDGCAPEVQSVEVATEDLLDLQSQIELLVASYPPEMQQRYLGASSTFLQAFLSIHNGDEQQALAFLGEVPVAERDDLYLFESGCLRARLGETAQGVELLRQALVLAPGSLLVIDALFQLLTEQGDLPAAQTLLQEQLELGADSAFCQAKICEIHAANGDQGAALIAAQSALAEGYAEQGFLVLAANLYEGAGEVELAEKLLSCLPGGGCSGGMNLALAELLLRQKRELGKVLDAFNDACRQEPQNPRWQLRVAQTYLARKWRKQGVELLHRVVGDPRLDDHLRLEAEQLLAEL